MESGQHTEPSNDQEEQLKDLKAGVREISHEITNPLGIIRMAVYFLQSTNPVGQKREHYFKVIDEGLERIEQSLQRLKSLRENPSANLESHPR